MLFASMRGEDITFSQMPCIKLKNKSGCPDIVIKFSILLTLFIIINRMNSNNVLNVGNFFIALEFFQISVFLETVI